MKLKKMHKYLSFLLGSLSQKLFRRTSHSQTKNTSACSYHYNRKFPLRHIFVIFTGPLSHIFKNEFCQQSGFSRGKDAEFWVNALNGSYKELVIQALNVLVQNSTTYLAENGFSVLVDIITKKRSCLLNDTLHNPMREASEQEVEPNWSEISRSMQQQTSH